MIAAAVAWTTAAVLLQLGVVGTCARRTGVICGVPKAEKAAALCDRVMMDAAGAAETGVGAAGAATEVGVAKVATVKGVMLTSAAAFLTDGVRGTGRVGDVSVCSAVRGDLDAICGNRGILLCRSPVLLLGRISSF